MRRVNLIRLNMPFQCGKLRYFFLFIITLLILLLEQVDQVFSFKCRECETRSGSCDHGECSGSACVLVAVTNAQNTMVIKKTCSNKSVQKHECTTTYPDGIESMQCYCSYDYCNSDAEMANQGLRYAENSASSASAPSAGGGGSAVNGGDRNKRTNFNSSQTFGISTNYLVMLIFMCLFITGSFSLLIFNTVCVHLC